MQINFTPQFNIANHSKPALKNHTDAASFVSQVQYKSVRANQLASKGLHFGSKNINQLYDEYNWYINNDKTPAIDAFLKIDESPEVMDGFLTTILNTDDRGYQFVDSIVRNPRKSREMSTSLSKKVGSNSKNVMVFLPNSPYQVAYKKYIDKRVENANTLSEVLRIRPDWKESKLVEKHQQLKGDAPLEIGNIPKEFPNDDLFKIADYLNNYREVGLKSNKKIDSLNINDRNYDFQYFTEGRSDKSVFGVSVPEGKNFVFKMGNPSDRSLNAPFALGTLAMIDSYLTTNRSRNSAPICYYNHDKNMSVYKYIAHTKVNGDEHNLHNISSHLPDFTALGLSYNDNVGYNNCFLMDDANEDLHDTEGFSDGVKNSEWISVDNDHVTYNNIWNPRVDKYSTELPNAMQMFF